MDLHEHQAKEILAKHGIVAPPGKLAYTAFQAISAFQQLGVDKCLVKAQVHSGGRGKAGGVVFCSSEREVEREAGRLLGSRLVTDQTGSRGRLVEKLYVEGAMPIGRELYLAFALDRASERIVLVASKKGGMDIEMAASADPDAIIRIPIDPAVGLMDFQAREIAFKLDMPRQLLKQATRVFQGCYRALISTYSTLVEINPLAVSEGEDAIYALDAKIVIDDNALFRLGNIADMRDKSQEDRREARASDFDLNYVGLEGNIGCMINGAGLAMATMDMIKHAGGIPANFLDIGGGASPDRVARAFELVLEDESVKAMLVNIYAGINRCDWIAKGIIQAAHALRVTVPLIVRLSGTNVELGRKILRESDVDVVSVDTLAEAAQAAVNLARSGS